MAWSVIQKPAILADMKNTILTPSFLIILMSFLPACDNGSNDVSTAGMDSAVVVDDKVSPSSTVVLYDRDITSHACDLLTADAVSAVSGVDPSVIIQTSIGGFCIYSWSGGNASLGHLRTNKKIEDARLRFKNGYRSQTGEELAEQMAQINVEMKKQQGDGTITAEPEQVEAVTGALSGTFAGGVQFEDIEGLGDIARFETTRIETKFGDQVIISYPNALNILTGNLKFTVFYNLDGEAEMYRDESVALAEAVLNQLSKL